MKDIKFTGSIHTHVRSLFDAQIEPKALYDKIKALGGRGVVITDHGVLSSIEDYRPYFDSEVKLIPGVEVYVDGGSLGREHLILIAVNDNGYKGISKIVTRSNETMQGSFPVISKEDLFTFAKDYQGDIIATSACMQGVLCSILLKNARIQKEIEKIREKEEKYYSPASQEVIEAEKAAKDAADLLDEKIAERDDAKTLSEMKFKKRESAIAKLSGEEKSLAEKELEKDKAISKEAADRLQGLKDAVDALRKAKSLADKNFKKACESVDKYMALEEKIAKMKETLIPEDTLIAEAEAEAEAYIEAFGADNFYIEIQYHGIKEESECFPNVVKVARSLNIKLVASNDVHILDNSNEERLKRCLLRSLRFKQWEDEQAGDSELYLKDNHKLAEMLLKILPEDAVEEGLENIAKIIDRCNVEFKTEKHYPKFSKTEDANALLEKAVEEGIAWRFPNGMDKEHEDRIKYELEIIESMGYADYHLIVKDFLEYGRLLGYVPRTKIKDAPLTIPELKVWIEENHWKNGCLRIGPGRGSAVGSLVCFCLGITNLDPLKYGLLFERFLNPERISMPDIDSDISNESRGKVIDYVKARYGEDCVCGIMTTDSQGPKGAIAMAAKYYGLRKYGEPLKNAGPSLSDDIPDVINVSFSTMVTEKGTIPEDDKAPTTTLYDYMYKKHESNKDEIEVLKWALVCEGMFTAYGAHAAGIVISDGNPISDYLPLRYNEGLNMMTTQCDMVQTEDSGLLKFDLLGLKTLDIISETMMTIEKAHGIIVDPLNIDLNDEKIYKEVFSKGLTQSVFQFASSGMKQMLKRFKPSSFEDLIILVSMYRPGPLQYLDDVIAVKNGTKKMTFLTPTLEPILGKTYGAIVYQEQVMQIFQSLAGYTLGGADMVRRFMSKKKKDKLEHEREAFINGDPERNIDGCVKRGIPAEIANELFDQMMAFASYAFNKSHAAAYAFNAYLTAWFKFYYPAEFFTAALNWTEKITEVSILLYEASLYDVQVLAPDVNLSEDRFSYQNGAIRFGLSSIASVKNHATNILEVRGNGAFKSLKDFIVRTDETSKIIENLICAGAFDGFFKNRKSMLNFSEELKSPLKKYHEKTAFIKSAEYVLPIIESIPSDEELINAQKKAGLKAEVKEKTTVQKLEAKISSAKEALKVIEEELNTVKIIDCVEDKAARMHKEKELLGIYLTEHPIDYYPSADEIRASVICNAEGDCPIYGVITDFTIRLTRKTGQQMATFKLEDRTGSINVVMFTKQFARWGKHLQNGKVVKLLGNVQIESDEENESIQFIADGVEEVKQKMLPVMYSVSSYATFHLEVEDAFRSKFEEEDGREFILYDKMRGEMRRMLYHVSDKVLEMPGFSEVNI